MSNNQQNQPPNQNSSKQQSDENSANGENKKSAPKHPPATERSMRTNSINFGEGKSDDIADF